jgi:hypothetical protein
VLSEFDPAEGKGFADPPGVAACILYQGALLKLLLDIPYYIELQRRMVDIFRYVSCHEKNFDAYSVILESLLIDTCSFFDSLCQTLIREKSRTGYAFTQEPHVGDFKKKVCGNEDFNFGDYRKLLESDFVLSTREVNLNLYEDALYSNPMGYLPDEISGHRIAPFKEWAAGVPVVPSPWWKAFTDLKHDRMRNFREAKLRNVLHSLAAVFIILTLRNETEFKTGSVSLEVYDLFFPKYWTFKGRVSVMNFMWL